MLGKNAQWNASHRPGCGTRGALIVARLPGDAPDTASAVSPETAVLDWNRHPTNALMNATATATPPGNPPGAGRSPPVAASHLAMVQGAVYDMINMIDGGYEPYQPTFHRRRRTHPSRRSPRAAHDVLVGLGRAPVPALPQVTIDWLDARHDDLEHCPTPTRGFSRAPRPQRRCSTHGRATAVTCRIRSKSETTPASGVRLSQEASTTRSPGVRNVEPFLLEDASQLGTRARTRSRAARIHEGVQRSEGLGGNGTTLTPNLRTPEQTALARFYIVNFELFNRTFRTIAQDEALTLVEQARLFAMLNLAGADGLISCWDDKAFWSFWRPITAIQLGDTDGNPMTDADGLDAVHQHAQSRRHASVSDHPSATTA